MSTRLPDHLRPLVGVYVTYRDADGTGRRAPALAAVLRHLALAADFPPPVVVSDGRGHGGGPFRLAAARNLAVRRAADDLRAVAVVVDADTLPDVEALREAVRMVVDEGDDWVIPYGRYAALDREATRAFLASGDAFPSPEAVAGAHSVGVAISGVWVVATDWWSDHGWDPGFVGWGPEDYAAKLMYESLHGTEARRVPGTVVSLSHPRPDDTQDDFDGLLRRNNELYAQYQDAALGGDRAMTNLLIDRGRLP